MIKLQVHAEQSGPVFAWEVSQVCMVKQDDPAAVCTAISRQTAAEVWRALETAQLSFWGQDDLLDHALLTPFVIYLTTFDT